MRYQLEEHPMPATMRAARRGQNLPGRSRITAREFVGVVLPEPQLRDLYQRQGLSFDQIAAQLNAPGTLDWLSWVVSGLADEYGIRRRPPPPWVSRQSEGRAGIRESRTALHRTV